jgi:hypothetical protein
VLILLCMRQQRGPAAAAHHQRTQVLSLLAFLVQKVQILTQIEPHRHALENPGAAHAYARYLHSMLPPAGSQGGVSRSGGGGGGGAEAGADAEADTRAGLCCQFRSILALLVHYYSVEGMLTYAELEFLGRRMPTYADVCWRVLTYADVC